MAGVTKEEISRAKELDLLTYFKLVEPGNLKLVGKEYRHKVHSSLTISKDSLWCWHCIGLHGRTALKYLIDVEKVPYVEAVREINRIQGGVVHSSQPVSLPQPHAEPEAPRDFKLPEPDTNSYSAMAYLRGRCIHPNVLAFCRREGILYQTSFKNHPNCVFVGRNGEGVAKGGSLRGCTQLQFRRDIPGSKKIYPFYIQASTKADTVEVYEAPIDAMSGASLKLMQHTGPWRSVHYLALGGTDYAALDAFLKYFPAVCKIVLCLDNDNAGRTRTQDIIAHLAGSGNRDGQQLFQVRNGQRIIENYADGSQLVKDVQTVDDTHFYVGSRFCHIQQYANQCFKRGCYVEPEHPQPGDKLDRLLIYQIPHYTCEYRFTDYDYAQNKLKATDYRCAYVANMPRDYTPDKCFQDFNYDDRPCANSMPSLSVSDLIVIERGDKAEAMYVDAVGFKDVSRLLPELHDMEVERQEHNLDELER